MVKNIPKTVNTVLSYSRNTTLAAGRKHWQGLKKIGKPIIRMGFKIPLTGHVFHALSCYVEALAMVKFMICCTITDISPD